MSPRMAKAAVHTNDRMLTALDMAPSSSPAVPAAATSIQAGVPEQLVPCTLLSTPTLPCRRQPGRVESSVRSIDCTTEMKWILFLVL
jgi:hypothetical protein